MKYLDRLRESFHTSFECLNPTLSTLRVLGFTQPSIEETIRNLSLQGNLELEIVSGSGVGHETPVFEALSERSNYKKDSQSTAAGPPSCASIYGPEKEAAVALSRII